MLKSVDRVSDDNWGEVEKVSNISFKAKLGGQSKETMLTAAENMAGSSGAKQAKLLVADDSSLEIKIICDILGNDYEILTAKNGKSAIELAMQEVPDLILLDVVMPEMDGFAACRILKNRVATTDIPVIFITAATNSQDIVKGFEAGGQDYITKPFSATELCARVRVHLDLKKSKETALAYAKKLEKMNEELNQLLDKIKVNAMTDYMTGLLNRRSIIEWIKEHLKNVKQNNGKITIVLADIDEFKAVNDTYGHDCGDVVIKGIAAIMKSVVSGDSAIARWGGEEFLLTLSGVDAEAGRTIAERLRKMVETTRFTHDGKPFSVTLTLGIAELDMDLGLEESIKRADEALYKGKRTTKNCVICHEI